MKSVLIIGMGRTGRHLASKMQELGNDVMIVDKNPAIIEALFIPLTADYSIYELPIQAAWIGQTLSGLNVRRKYQINIIAVKHDNEINPNVGPDYRFREGDHIILIGRSNEVFKLAAKM